MKDKTGNQEILVGSYIVYGHAMGRCAGLKFGKVIKVDDKDRYHVIGVDDDWIRQRIELTKKGILQFPERIIVLPFEMLPDYAQELLGEI